MSRVKPRLSGAGLQKRETFQQMGADQEQRRAVGARKGGFLEEAVHLRYIPKNSSKRNSQGLSAKKGAMPERRGGFRGSRRVVYVVYRKGLRGHEDVSQSQGYKRKGTF